MQWFYDEQLKRYITQLIRMFSGFKYKNGEGEHISIPILYGDLTRQVGAILRDNSENKVPSAPRMATYINRLELDKSRLADATFVSKSQIKERKLNHDHTAYLNEEGHNYTVERLMPTPYLLGISLDIWSTNTDQKLQILEQILMLFNPSLDLQTTDNYIDWTSISTVYLDEITWTSRTIPSGTESNIDVATLNFSLPIYISPPIKVKRMGVITDIITRITENEYVPGIDNYTDISTGFSLDKNGDIVRARTEHSHIINEDSTNDHNVMNITKINYAQTSLVIDNDSASLVSFSNSTSPISWDSYMKLYPETYVAGVSQVRLQRYDWPYEIVGRLFVNTSDTTIAAVEWDIDTFPEDTILEGPNGEYNKIDFIIDPQKTSPDEFLGDSSVARILILNDIGDKINKSGAVAWKDVHGNDLIAEENDIIEWDGEAWHIVYDASMYLATYTNEIHRTIFVSNLKTGVQYKFSNDEWLLSIDGEYTPGSWRLVL